MLSNNARRLTTGDAHTPIRSSHPPMVKYLENILRVSRISLNEMKLSIRHVKQSFFPSGMEPHAIGKSEAWPRCICIASFAESWSTLTKRMSQASLRISTCTIQGYIFRLAIHVSSLESVSIHHTAMILITVHSCTYHMTAGYRQM